MHPCSELFFLTHVSRCMPSDMSSLYASDKTLQTETLLLKISSLPQVKAESRNRGKNHCDLYYSAHEKAHCSRFDSYEGLFVSAKLKDNVTSQVKLSKKNFPLR